MRAPRRHRPRKRVMQVPPDVELDCLADQVTYVGSPEHKGIPSFAGPPRLRADASCCPRWYKHGETVFEGRLVNRGTGSYKGFPLRKKEWPEGIESLYAEN